MLAHKISSLRKAHNHRQEVLHSVHWKAQRTFIKEKGDIFLPDEKASERCLWIGWSAMPTGAQVSSLLLVTPPCLVLSLTLSSRLQLLIYDDAEGHLHPGKGKGGTWCKISVSLLLEERKLPEK